MKISVSMTTSLAILASALGLATACKTPGNQSDSLSVAATNTPTGAPITGTWSDFCTAGSAVTDPMTPNYNNPVVVKAAQILTVVNPESYYLYGDVLAKHASPLPSDAGSKGFNKEAHNFLAYLCGEFRDSPSMMIAKLNWVYNIRYLNSAPSGNTDVSCEDLNNPLLGNGTAAVKPYVVSESPWKQMCIGDYQKYLDLSESVFDYRQKTLKKMTASPGSVSFTYDDGRTVSDGLTINGIRVDRNVPGYTVCETKYMFANYVKKGIGLSSNPNESWDVAYKRYDDGYKNFKSSCSADDLNYYYDFRGDSNFKPNSPESNAMIWFSRTMARHCATRGTKVQGGLASDADCQRYYENPFKSRYAAARAGLGAWMLHAPNFEKDMNNTGSTMFTVVQHQVGSQTDIFGEKGPYFFRIGDSFNGKALAGVGSPGTYFPNYQASWNDPDFGMAKLSGKTGADLSAFIFNRINNAVDRHTDWYRSGFDNAPGLSSSDKRRMTNSQAYSPFVASSYEMSRSNGFTACGPTIPCNGKPDFDDHRHWMFIFKIKKDNWFQPEQLAAGNTTIDFDRMWFDETGFGDTGLANEERAWDRLGSPKEEEFEEILYLYRIDNNQ